MYRAICEKAAENGDDGLDHRKLPREDRAGIESVDSRKLPRDRDRDREFS
jgi:hypothetical protein